MLQILSPYRDPHEFEGKYYECPYCGYAIEDWDAFECPRCERGLDVDC